MTQREDDFNERRKACQAQATRFPARQPPHCELSVTASRETWEKPSCSRNSHRESLSHLQQMSLLLCPTKCWLTSTSGLQEPLSRNVQEEDSEEGSGSSELLFPDWAGQCSKLESTSLTRESYAAPNGLPNKLHFRLFTSDLMF
ncbi:hypothetical protein MTO96_016779 [Rhipicephalus appendiculatus]